MQAAPSSKVNQRKNDDVSQTNTSHPMTSTSNTSYRFATSSNASPQHGISSPTPDSSDASRLFSATDDTTGMTSFDSIKNAPERVPNKAGGGGGHEFGHDSMAHNEGEHNAATRFDPLTGATKTSSLAPSHYSHSWRGVPSGEYDMSQNNTINEDSNFIPRTITDLPIRLLQRIFTIASTRSYSSRLSLPLVCKIFHTAVQSCPQMWDTFEVMTGNQGALTSKSQVEHVAAKAGSGPLSIGLTIAMSRLGAWKSGEPLRPWGGTGLNDDAARSAQTLQIQGLNLVGTMLSLMPRVRDFILDVHDDPLEPALARAMLALFDDGLAEQLRSVTFVGDYQLDRIVRLTTPSKNAPSLLQPLLASLRHLTIAYCSAFSLPGPLFQVETLEISVLTIEASPGTHPLENLLLNFPNLLTLKIRTTIDTSMAQPQPLTILGITSNHSEPPIVSLNYLDRLVVESLPLTSSFFSSLNAPNLQALELKELTLGFDPRDVRFEMFLAGHHVGSKRSSGHGLLPLPLGTFLSRLVEHGSIKELTLGGIPDMVVRMCVDFVRGVDGNMAGRNGLADLHLIGFEWKDWEPLIVPPPSPSPPTNLPSDTPLAEVPLPHLRTISVFLDHASAWTSRGTVTFDYEAKFDRQGWMDGLMRFAEGRMNVQAVVRMFRESKMELEEWMKTNGNGQLRYASGSAGGGGVLEDPLRTLMHVELDAGYKDAYAFVHGAWKAMEREHLALEGIEVEESRNAG